MSEDIVPIVECARDICTADTSAHAFANPQLARELVRSLLTRSLKGKGVGETIHRMWGMCILYIVMS